ncbi:unnamed protein product [Rotaria sp. Silwood2]|nr:unnamed protein product [Rotaria sp. Silwood2]CAF2644426.1 unnamed protein product [Rotaria sp. Silwood2]CAF2904418.1 unnamed protein product [Rotaria sp. Silwood2]CAF3071714.1 unnamed protein product [Rotaria sp. Silwood2]CAF3859340.1 unnamed protein product [Rotaria sp. Silwood2]
MFIFQSIFFMSILLITNAQWYIKKNYQSKFMNYPNPGKRSLPDEQSILFKTDCQIPYSQLHSYQQTAAWILMCGSKKSSLKHNENSNNFEFDLSSTPKLIVYKKKSSNFVQPYYKDYDNSLNKYLMKLVQRAIRNQ